MVMAEYGLDEEFQRKLEETIKSDRLPDKICRALQLDNELPSIKSESWRRFIYRFNQVSLAWICRVNLVNFLESTNVYSGKLTFKQNFKRLIRDPTAKGAYKRWPLFIGLAYILCTIKILVNIYLQYIHDANRAKLQRLQTHLGQESERHRLTSELQLDVDKLEEELRQQAERAHYMARLIGCPYVDWPFVTEAVAIILSQTIFWVLLVPLRHHVGDWVWLSAKAILDQDHEHQTRTNLVLDELQHLIVDSLSFSRVKLEQFVRHLTSAVQDHGDVFGRARFRSLAREALDTRSVYLTKNHWRTVEQLKLIALEGRLNPLNRIPASRDKLARSCFISIFTFFLYTNLLIIGFHIYLQLYFSGQNRELKLDTLQDWLSLFCLAFLVEVAVIRVSFISPLLVFTIYDLVEATNHLGTLITHVIRTNETRYREMSRLVIVTGSVGDARGDSIARYTASLGQRRPTAIQLASTKSSTTAHYRYYHNNNATACKRAQRQARNIELDLLMIVIQCRLGMRAFALVKEPLARLVSLVIYFAISVPIVFCIHSAYFSAQLKLVTLSGSLASTFCCLCLLAPLGLLYKRSIRAFGTLWSLVAQLSYFETVPLINKHLMLDSSVTLFNLRRLLADMRFTMEILTIRWLTISITYANLIRIFSWILLFMMAGSILSVRLFGEGLGSIMSDPFGLFKFLKTNSTMLYRYPNSPLTNKLEKFS